ncbi:MAG: AAA family ATPase [Christensenellaceae bacterium]|jgi:adenylate kinase|nr:AAA family ATPase [Christensenellaceae bacterium]
MGGTIFIAGVYGTGKSTLCNKLSAVLKMPFFSAGDLISEINQETYGANKVVADKDKNQILLSNKVHALNLSHKRIILAGHFCIFNAFNLPEPLPESVFENLNIKHIILLEADAFVIIQNLKQRDLKDYAIESIKALISCEREQYDKVSARLNCPSSIYQMTFSDKDCQRVCEIITREGN